MSLFAVIIPQGKGSVYTVVLSSTSEKKAIEKAKETLHKRKKINIIDSWPTSIAVIKCKDDVWARLEKANNNKTISVEGIHE